LPAGVVLEYLDMVRLGHEIQAGKPRSDGSRLRPPMRLGELYDEWKSKRKPTPKTAHEYRASVDDFIAYIDDIPVCEITEDDLLNFRDAVAAVHRHLPHPDCVLSFSKRHYRHAADVSPKINVATLKKCIGGVQAPLSFAKRHNWIKANVGAGLSIDGEGNGVDIGRRSFHISELQCLFVAPLFTTLQAWRIINDGISDSTMFWLFLIGATSGARLEKIGQAGLVTFAMMARRSPISISTTRVQTQSAG